MKLSKLCGYRKSNVRQEKLSERRAFVASGALRAGPEARKRSFARLFAAEQQLGGVPERGTSRSPFAIAAFTLIELLLVMVMIAILLSVSLSSFSGMRQQVVFRDAVGRAQDLIQSTRSKALSNLTLSTGETADAFYLTIDATTNILTLYADVPSGTDEVLEEETLDGTISINLSVDLGQIRYLPPKGDLQILLNDGTSVTDLEILLADGTSENTIYLNEISGVPQ